MLLDKVFYTSRVCQCLTLCSPVAPRAPPVVMLVFYPVGLSLRSLRFSSLLTRRKPSNICNTATCLASIQFARHGQSPP